MAAFGIVLLVLGWALGFYSWILLLVRAFTTSVAWGLVSLLVPLGNLVYTCTHWEEGRRPFVTGLISLVVMAGGVCTLPGIGKSLWPMMQALDRQHRSEAASGQGDGADQAIPAVDLNMEIGTRRDESYRLQEEVDSETKSLVPIFNDLAKRRAQLKPGDQAGTASFNRDAAAYTARKRQLDSLRRQMAASQEELSALLTERAAAPPAISINSGRVVTIYGTSWCPACKTAREYLQSRGVAFRDVDVERSTEGAQEFHQRGGTAVPLIVINGEQTTGFNSTWVDAHLRQQVTQ
jgi:glutaredoxin